jgi:hypothetical protein
LEHLISSQLSKIGFLISAGAIEATCISRSKKAEAGLMVMLVGGDVGKLLQDVGHILAELVAETLLLLLQLRLACLHCCILLLTAEERPGRLQLGRSSSVLLQVALILAVEGKAV